MKKIKSNKRKTGFLTGSGKFFLTVTLIYLAFYTGNRIFDISKKRIDTYKRDHIEIQGNKLITTDRVLEICGFRSLKSAEIKINVDSLASQIMNLKYVKGISITHRPPQILNITIEEYEPVAFIYGKGLNLIDGNGYLIPVPDTQLLWDLPFISGIEQGLGTLGKPAKAAEAYLALEIVRYLNDENPLLAGLVSEINLSNNKTIELHLIKGGTKIRISRESFYKELFILKSYIANYLDWNQLTSIEYIDLRFANQLVVKKKT